MGNTKINVAELSKQESLKLIIELFKNNPSVLEEKPELIELLEFSTPKEGNVTSLTSRQSAQLKQQLTEMRDRGQQLLKNAKQYDQLNDKIYSLINATVASDNLLETATIITKETKKLFNIDYASIVSTMGRIKSSDFQQGGDNEEENNGESNAEDNIIFDASLNKIDSYTHIAERLAQGKCLCSDRFPMHVLDFFFGHQHADQIKSAAFVPLIGKSNKAKDLFGMLCFGSKNKAKFSSKLKGTIHLERLGKITALSIERINNQN
jgi:uncharacterized protein YigA (DUF484 family)